MEDIILRRMANTGETREVAERNTRRALELVRSDARAAGQGWVDSWIAEVPWEKDEGALEWLRSRPRRLYPLLISFPPSCVVRPLAPLLVPAPGTFGIVSSWVEDKEGENHRVGVRQHPDAQVRAECRPEQLEVVGFWRGWTSERVRSALGVGGA